MPKKHNDDDELSRHAFWLEVGFFVIVLMIVSVISCYVFF